MNKFVLLSIFLVFSSAFAQDFAFRAQHVDNSSVGDKADVLNFFKGFLKGVGEDQVYDSIKDCIKDSKSIINNLVKGVLYIETMNAIKVQEGIALIGKACDAVPVAIQQCKAGGADVATLLKLIKSFKNPASFIYYVGKSIIINRVEVYGEISKAVTAAHQHDFETFGYWVGRAMNTIFLGDNSVNTLNSKEDVLAFTKGFLTGISTQSIFDNIKACISDSETFYKEVSTGIADIRSRDPARVREGIALLGQAVQLIPTAAQDCKAAEQDIKKLVKLAKEFTSPASFIYHIGKSLLINRIEVIHEVTNAVEAFEHKDFYNLGYWVGRAMDTIFLGLNQPLRQGLVDFLNSNQNSWTAEISPKFANMTLAEIKAQFLGVPLDYNREEMDIIYNYEGQENNDIPISFNSSEQWPGCVHPIRDQGHCGSCWAFAASEVLSDRFCIATKRQINVILSPQDLVSCAPLPNQGCNGGYPLYSWGYMKNKGLVTESCFPYQSFDGHSPKCSTFTKCHDGQPIKNYYAKKSVHLTNPASIQQDILKHGPVEAAFEVYEDFMSYRSGIYKHTSGSLLGGHAVKIIGWGREGTTDYWIVANSWNTTWGEHGFFRIAFGQVGIDKNCRAGEADVERTRQSSARWFQ